MTKVASNKRVLDFQGLKEPAKKPKKFDSEDRPGFDDENEFYV